MGAEGDGVQFETLGSRVLEFKGFDTFPKPDLVENVVLTSDEVTALCPVTGQPDWYTVEVAYQPRGLCLESKCFKLYLQSFRQKGLFCEALASDICLELAGVLNPHVIEVRIVQKPRGGVTIEPVARWWACVREDGREAAGG